MSLIFRLILWLGLPTWVLPLIGVGFVSLALSFAYLKGFNNAAAKCEAASLRVQLAGLQRDIDTMKAADALEAEEVAKLETLMKDYEAEIAAYEIELAAKPDENCVLDDDDLRSIDGMRSGGRR